MRRRTFLSRSASILSGSACASLVAADAWAEFAPKRVLVLGGTLFLGPAVVDALVARGHSVTLFNRGVTNPELFPNLERLKGFRSADLGDQDFLALSRRRFDAIVDVWPNEPEVAASAAEILKDRAPHYLFVSSVAAYDSRQFATKTEIREDAPLQPWASDGGTYNRNKAECERRLGKIIGERLTIVRPGPIKGHRDDTPDLLTWLLRLRDGGQHIGPGNGNDPVEFVDVKDVGRFIALAVERSMYGAYNLAGKSMTFREFLEACKKATGSDAKLVWISENFLHQHGLDSDAMLGTFAGNFPFWRPDAKTQGLFRVSSDKAYGAGWRTRSFEETAIDVEQDFHFLHLMEASNVLTAEKEKAVLDAWSLRQS